jgi:hypothetical protein
VSGLENVPGLLFGSVVGSACLGAAVYRKLDSMLTKVRAHAGSVSQDVRVDHEIGILPGIILPLANQQMKLWMRIEKMYCFFSRAC